MIGGEPVLRIGGVVLQDRCQPQCCDTKLTEIVQVLTDAVQVAPMSQRRLTAVFPIRAHTFDLRVVTGTLCKAVWHQHIEYVGIGETLSLAACHLSLSQRIVYF